MFISIHVEVADALEMAGILGYLVDEFPHSYLGLPLSVSKVPSSPYGEQQLAEVRPQEGEGLLMGVEGWPDPHPSRPSPPWRHRHS
jgi:hypothetical protein